MTVRKTVSVQFVKDKTNYFLAESAPEQSQARLGMAMLLESVLFETNNYKGYSFLPSEWDGAAQELRDGYDDSRRRYF